MCRSDQRQPRSSLPVLLGRATNRYLALIPLLLEEKRNASVIYHARVELTDLTILVRERP